MKLKIAEGHSFEPEDYARLVLRYEGAEVTPELLVEISQFTAVAVCREQCTETEFAIDHPHSW